MYDIVVFALTSLAALVIYACSRFTGGLIRSRTQDGTMVRKRNPITRTTSSSSSGSQQIFTKEILNLDFGRPMTPFPFIARNKHFYYSFLIRYPVLSWTERDLGLNPVTFGPMSWWGGVPGSSAGTTYRKLRRWWRPDVRWNRLLLISSGLDFVVLSRPGQVGSGLSYDNGCQQFRT